MGIRMPINLLRPLVGYGPEAMWVAFNRFYPPDLAHIEARNASPDRSHNETWDSLVVTGILGLSGLHGGLCLDLLLGSALAGSDRASTRYDPLCRWFCPSALLAVC